MSEVRYNNVLYCALNLVHTGTICVSTVHGTCILNHSRVELNYT